MKPKVAEENSSHKPSAEEQFALEAVHVAGASFRAMHKKLSNIFDERLRKQIRDLKVNTFKVKAGSPGRFVLVGDKQFKWADFVKANFDVTENWLNEIIRTKEEREAKLVAREAEHAKSLARIAEAVKVAAEDERELAAKIYAPVETPVETTAADKEWAKFHVGETITPVTAEVATANANHAHMTEVIADGKAERQMLEAVAKQAEADAAREAAITPELIAGAKTQLTASFKKMADAQRIAEAKKNNVDKLEEMRDTTYDYFGQFADELQALGDELASMLIEFKLDLPSIKEVLRYAEASAKRDLKQLTTAKAA